MNQLFCKSSVSMPELPDESVGLCVTSPPYNVSKEYEVGQTFADWVILCTKVFREVHRVLVAGGRVCIVIANTGRNPYQPLHAYLIAIMRFHGFLLRGEIIWDKGPSVGSSTAWGSWMSASNPSLRDVHEYILVFSKGIMRRPVQGENTISRDEFLEATKSVWTIPTASAKSIGHPAPFPLEIPRRLIQLYSFKEDLILDPFVGSGQTCIAALQLGRRYVGYEVVPEYIRLAERRIQAIAVSCGRSAL